ncbi:MAG: hypothetical protein JOZ69_09960 [Myxococcales bacterium]|nr:hypothetical protein [Myxococcales bacterium]
MPHATKKPAPAGFAARIVSLLRDERGALYTEYLVVTGFVALGTSVAILYCAYAVAGNFAAIRQYLLYPFP